ncbi:hypothetical protein ACIRUL_11540 [Streptomyces sp. NPDC101171]
MPLLFQWRTGGQNRPISETTIRRALNATLDFAGLTDNAGQPLDYQPHDFRRIFITDAIMNGLPPHIAQIIAGHDDIRPPCATRRSTRRRPSKPTARSSPAAERPARVRNIAPRPTKNGTSSWVTSSSGISPSAPAEGPLEPHASMNTPASAAMLRPDPGERNRLVKLRDNLIDRIAKAEREGWLGDVKGLTTNLDSAKDKLAQMDAQAARTQQAISI